MKKLPVLLFFATSFMASAQCVWTRVYDSAKHLRFSFDKQGEVLGQFSQDNFASSYNHVGVPTTPVSPATNSSCAKYSNDGTAIWMLNENYDHSTIIPFDNGKFFLGSLINRILNSNGSATGITFPTTGYTYHEGFSNQLLQFNGTTLNALDINTGAILTTSNLAALSGFVISTTYVKGSDLYLIGHYFSTSNYSNNVIIKLNSTMTVSDVRTTTFNITKMAITDPGLIYLCRSTEIGTFDWSTSAYTVTEVTGYSNLLKYDPSKLRTVYFNANSSAVKYISDMGVMSSYAITVTGVAPVSGIEVDYHDNEILICGSNTSAGSAGGSYNGISFPYLPTSSVYENVILHKISMKPPGLSFSVQSQNICPGNTVTYYNTSTGNPTSYLWIFPGGSPSSSTLPNPTVTYCNEGRHDVSLKVTNCAGSSKATYRDFISVSYDNCSEPTCAGTFAKNFGSAGFESADVVKTDAAGNIYTAGVFRQPVDFDPGPGVSTLTPTALYNEIYITKFDADGNFIWAKQLVGQANSSNANIPNDMVIDNQGNLYLTGTFYQTVDFDPGSATYNLTTGIYSENFVLKLTTCGEFVWAKKYGIAGPGTTNDIAIDNANNIYIAGHLPNMTVNIGPFALTSAGSVDGFVARMDASGTFLWAQNIGSSGIDYITDLKTNSRGSVILTGLFSSTVDFNPNRGVFNLTSAGGYDAFILTLDPFGNFVWAKRIGGTGDDVARELVINSSDDIIAIGDYVGVVDFDPNAGVQNLSSVGGKDVFVLRLSSAGNYIWAGSMGSTTDNYSRAMSIDRADNIYVSGDYSGPIDVDPTAGVFNIGAGMGSYISKINSSNAFVWGKKISYANINSLGNTTHNDLIAVGAFNGTTDFDINAGVTNLSSNGSADAFIAKYCTSNLLRVAKTEEENAIASSTEAITGRVSIFPNPSSGRVFVSIPTEWKEGRITVYNSVGQTVMTGEVDAGHKAEFSLENLKDSLYSISVSDGEHSATEKLFKQTNN